MSEGPRTCIASGGTGALGRAVVAAFLSAGDRVVVPWIVPVEREMLTAAHPDAGARLVLVEADVTDEAGAAAVARDASGASVLINGVGGFEGGSPVHEGDVSAFDRMYRINLRSAACLSHAVVPGMIAAGGGSVANVCSEAVQGCPPGLAAYAASKAGVAVLTRTLQGELATHGVRVNAVSPATIDTPANRAAMPDADFSTWTPPAAIAETLLWLASPAAAAVRGAIIPV